MKNVTSLSIDLAKNVFQLHGTDKKGKIILQKKIGRSKLSELIARIKPCNIYMEACGTANYWGREFQKYGHKVKLINPRYVKPYVKRNKNDVNDAAGIAAAARDPDMRFCEVKTEAQQDIQSIHRTRSLLMQQRTALSNQVRGLLLEYGIAIPQGISHLRSMLAVILGNNPNDLSGEMISCLAEIYERFQSLDKRVNYYDKRIEALFKTDEACQRLEKIPGIGVLGATILSSILGNGGSFKNGRHFAAFLGLVPKQHSSGGKERLLGISKGGDTYVRSLLIHGARSVLARITNKNDKLSVWLKRLKLQKGYNKSAVALANKIARTAWAVIKEGNNYNVNYKPRFLKAA